MTVPAAPPDLRDRLEVLRRDALQQLAAGEGLDAGLLELVAHATAALGVIEGAEEPARPQAGNPNRDRS